MRNRILQLRFWALDFWRWATDCVSSGVLPFAIAQLKDIPPTQINRNWIKASDTPSIVCTTFHPLTLLCSTTPIYIRVHSYRFNILVTDIVDSWSIIMGTIWTPLPSPAYCTDNYFRFPNQFSVEHTKFGCGFVLRLDFNSSYPYPIHGSPIL